MNKTELVRTIHNQLDKEKITLKQIDMIVDKCFEVISSTIEQGEDVSLGNFGSFSQTSYSVRTVEKYIKGLK